MEQYLRRRDKAVLTALVVLLLITGIATAINYFTQRADNAFTAMARGQYKLARHYYEEEVEAGSPQAMNHLANLHYLGLGTQRNHKTAAQLYLDASSAGFAAAQLNLGHLFRQGIGVAGYAPAQLNLGHLYRQGIGVPQDALRAFSWYSMSDIHGSPWAEQYMRHTAVEFTLTPGQINSAKESWPTLSALVEEGL